MPTAQEHYKGTLFALYSYLFLFFVLILHCIAGSDCAARGRPHKSVPHPRRQHHRPPGPRAVRRHHPAGMFNTVAQCHYSTYLIQ